MTWPPSRWEHGKTSPFGLVLLFAALSLVMPQGSFADSGQERTRLLVVRGDAADVDESMAREVDLRIAQTLARHGHFAAHFSPTPYAEVKLAAGCGKREAECVRSIAESIGSEWLLVRDLVLDKHGTAQLTLMAQDGRPSATSRSVTAPLSRKLGETPKQVVPQLVARLYPPSATLALKSPEPGAPKSPHFAAPSAPTPAVQSDGVMSEHAVDLRGALGWSSIAAASALMVTGAVFAVLSGRDETAYADQGIRSQSDVDHAQSLLESAEREAKIANGLLIGGAGLAVVGTGLLVWQHISRRGDRRAPSGTRAKSGARSLRLGAAPQPGGAMLLVGGNTSGSKRALRRAGEERR